MTAMTDTVASHHHVRFFALPFLLILQQFGSTCANDVDLTPDGKVDKSYILSGADQEHQSPTSNWVFLILQPILWGCCCFIVYVHQKRRSSLISTRHVMVERRRRAREAAAEAEANFDEDARFEEVLSKFHIHEVPADDKTVNDEESLSKDAITAGQSSLDKDDNIKEEGRKGSEPDATTTTYTTAVTATTTISQRLSSLWNSSTKAECSICLEGYSPGEKVCISHKAECPHVFHQECIAEWLKKHDRCPLCRVDLMK